VNMLGKHNDKYVNKFLIQFLFMKIASQTQQVQVSAAGRPARRPPCWTQVWTVSRINWWPTTVTSLSHWLFT